MQQQNLEILVENRKVGKLHCRKYRRLQKIPGVVYGSGKQNFNFVTEEKILRKYAGQKYENVIFTLKSDEAAVNGTKVLLKEVIVQPVTRRPLHVDMLAIDMNKEVKISVELRFEGKAEGISEGGVLQPILRQLEVWCLPAKIPEFIAVDVSPLHVGQALHLSEIKLPDGVRATTHEDIALVTVTVIKDEEPTPQATAAAAATAAGAAAPVAGGAAPAAGGAAAPAAAAADAKPAAAKPAAKK